MKRITDRDLDGVVARLNRITGSPDTYADKSGPTLKINVGHYYLEKAYGGNQLVRICNPGGGVTTPLGSGFDTKRECYEKIQAFICGIETRQPKE